jgi:hypothetical protein
MYTPLDQFEIRELVSLDILSNVRFSLTNIAMYLIIAYFIAIINLSLLSNIKKIGSNP